MGEGINDGDLEDGHGYQDEPNAIGQVGINSSNCRPWYKRRRILGAITAFILIVLAIVLGVVLSQQSGNNQQSSDAANNGGSFETSGSDGDEDTLQDQKNDIADQGSADGTEPFNSSSNLRANDDTATIISGIDDVAFIDVLENDVTSNSPKAIVVKSITAQAAHGECVISMNLKEIVYTPPNIGEYIGSDECTYEACIVDESDEWGNADCDTAVARIEIIEDEVPLVPQTTTSMSDVVIPGSEKLVSDIHIINTDAVVAIDGNTAIVGDSSFDTYKGTVLVFARVNDPDTGKLAWMQRAKLSPPDDKPWTYFGWSVAIHKDTIIVGAWGDESNKGCAHVFVRDGPDSSTWFPESKLDALDGKAEDHLGYDVAIHGDTAIVGAWQDGIDGNDIDTTGVVEKSGSAYVFVRYGDAWLPIDKLVAPDGAANDRFGNSVAIYGDTIVVGAWWDDADAGRNSTNSGSAHIYVRKDTNEDANDDSTTTARVWKHQQKIMDIVGESEDRFGNRVAIYGDTIIVGARGDDADVINDKERTDFGAAYILVRNGEGTWIHQTKLVAPDGTTGDQFGNSIAIYGDTCVVGARWDDDNGKESGSAHVFVRDANDLWNHRAKLLAADGNSGDYFGFSVGIHENTVLVGSMNGDVHVFSDYLDGQ